MSSTNWSPIDFGYDAVVVKDGDDVYAKGNIWQRGKFRLMSLGRKVFVLKAKTKHEGDTVFRVRFYSVIDTKELAAVYLVNSLRDKA